MTFRLPLGVIPLIASSGLYWATAEIVFLYAGIVAVIACFGSWLTITMWKG